ncbi:MAG: MFS transporter [Anaerolineales bacterium]|nr:MFS transporter [Anaerolineales bacterium]
MKTKRSSKFILNLLGFGTAVSLLGDATLYTVLPHPDISAQLGITLSMVGLLLGANRAVRLVLNGPVGFLYDRMPRRGLLIAALSLGAGSSIFYAAGSGFWPLLIGRILWGLAWSLLWVGGNSVVLDVSTEENRGRNSGMYQMWFFIGVAAASLLGSMLTDMFGFRNGQWISVGIIAATALVWVLLLPETRAQDTSVQDASEDIDRPGIMRLPWKVMAVISFTIFISRFLAWGVLAATAVLWLSDIFGTGVQLASYVIPITSFTGLFTALRNLIGVVSTPLAGAISDRYGRRWPVIGLAMIMGGLGLGMMSGEIHLLALIGAFLVPIAGSSIEALTPAIAGDQVPKKVRSRALGLINTAGDLGATIGPFAALGAIHSGWLSLGGIYRIGGALFGLAALLAFSPLVSRQRKISATDERIT